MQPNEIVLRLSYLNVLFKGLTCGVKNFETLTDDGLKKMYDQARVNAEQPLEMLISKATEEFGENVASLLRLKGYFGEYLCVPVDQLCFDDAHESYGLFRGSKIKRGDSLTDFYQAHKDHPELHESVQFIHAHKTFFYKHIPMIVRAFNGRFEVLEGNHRAFCAVMNHEAQIPALLASKEIPLCPATTLDFSL